MPLGGRLRDCDLHSILLPMNHEHSQLEIRMLMKPLNGARLTRLCARSANVGRLEGANPAHALNNPTGVSAL